MNAIELLMILVNSLKIARALTVGGCDFLKNLQIHCITCSDNFSGRSWGGARGPVPYFGLKKITKGRKAGKASQKKKKWPATSLKFWIA